MGTYLTRHWMADGQGSDKAERMGGAYHPYVPDRLCDHELALLPACAAAVARAQEALARLDGSSASEDSDAPARLLLRAEATSSSRIEDLEMPAIKLLEYEELDRLGVDCRIGETETQILNNICALTSGLAQVGEGRPVTFDLIRVLNHTLLVGTHLENVGGIIRSGQGWIGGNRFNPVGAAYVPPPPEEVPALMDDLVTFIVTSELPPVAVAALAHAQFETIHPFADGNGRVGRMLVQMILRAFGFSRYAVPPVSAVLAADRERYIANLEAFRCGGDTARECAACDWVEYFSNVLVDSCEWAERFESALFRIRDWWLAWTSFRSDSAARHLLDTLLGTPAMSIKTAQELTGRSYPAVRAGILALQDAGILRLNSKSRKSGIYVAEEVVTALNACGRPVATAKGEEVPQLPTIASRTVSGRTARI